MNQTPPKNGINRRKFLILAAGTTLAGCAGVIPDGRIDHDESTILLNEPAFIPGGTFVMGNNSEGDHSPAHEVTLAPFFLDRYEVTNAQYGAFCETTHRQLPEFWGQKRYRSGPKFPNHPVVGVSWYDARDYAHWAGKRLPTEAEWEYAARGGQANKQFPWGDILSIRMANYNLSGNGAPVPVGSYDQNDFGLFDMTGNVLEWVHDYYAPDYYSQSLAENPWGPEEGRFRVVRGGGWHSGASCLPVYYRNALPSNWLDFAVGFRCAKDV